MSHGVIIRTVIVRYLPVYVHWYVQVNKICKVSNRQYAYVMSGTYYEQQFNAGRTYPVPIVPTSSNIKKRATVFLQQVGRTVRIPIQVIIIVLAYNAIAICISYLGTRTTQDLDCVCILLVQSYNTEVGIGSNTYWIQCRYVITAGVYTKVYQQAQEKKKVIPNTKVQHTQYRTIYTILARYYIMVASMARGAEVSAAAAAATATAASTFSFFLLAGPPRACTSSL